MAVCPTPKEDPHGQDPSAALERDPPRPDRPRRGSEPAPRAAGSSGRYRQGRYRRRRAQPEWPGSRRVGDRRDDGAADEVRQDGRHRRPGALRDSRPADRQLQRLGARVRARGFAQGACQAGPADQSDRRAGAGRAIGGALLPGDLLVHDDEDSAGEGFRRHHRYPEERHAGNLASPDEQHRLHRLPSARPGIDAHDPGRARASSIRGRKHGAAA